MSEENIISAKEIYDELNKYVVGQKDAKKALSTVIFLHLSKCAKAALTDDPYGNKSNLLIMGPSGCGKTYMLDVIEDLVGLPVFKINAKDISQMGFKGMSMEDYLEQFFKKLGGDESATLLLEHSIIFIDEIDKLCGRYATASGDDHNGSIQHGLLKTIEGASFYVEGKRKTTYEIRTNNILFVLGGNFKGIRDARKLAKKQSIGFVDNSDKVKALPPHKELMQAGLKQELAGRISRVVEIFELTKPQLTKAIMEIEQSPIQQYEDLFSFYGKTLKLTKKTIAKLVEECHTNGTGVRGLQTALDRHLEDKVFNMDPESIYIEEEE